MSEVSTLKQGYVHVYTGNGKGKTTAAIGLGVRATGAGYKVHMLQFMKGRRYNELNSLEHINNFTISQYGRDEFVNRDHPEKIDLDFARAGFTQAKALIKNGAYDMLILDEINVAIDFKLLRLNEVLQMIKEKPEPLELILTGRYAHPELIRMADYVSEILEIKHPYQKGIKTRSGIDF